MSNNGTEAAKSAGARDENGLTPAQRTWLEHIRQCEAEGLTYKAHCQREGLKVGGLYAARKVLRGHDDAQTSLAASGSPPRNAAVRLSHAYESGALEAAPASRPTITEPKVIAKILAHIAAREAGAGTARAPPSASSARHRVLH